MDIQKPFKMNSVIHEGKMGCDPCSLKGHKIYTALNFDLKLGIFHCSHRGTFGAILSKIWDGAHCTGWVGMEWPMKHHCSSQTSLHRKRKIQPSPSTVFQTFQIRTTLLLKKSWKQLVQCDSKQRTTKTRTVIQGCMRATTVWEKGWHLAKKFARSWFHLLPLWWPFFSFAYQKMLRVYMLEKKDHFYFFGSFIEMVDEKFFSKYGCISGKFTKGAQVSFDLDQTFRTPADLQKSWREHWLLLSSARGRCAVIDRHWHSWSILDK